MNVRGRPLLATLAVIAALQPTIAFVLPGPVAWLHSVEFRESRPTSGLFVQAQLEVQDGFEICPDGRGIAEHHAIEPPGTSVVPDVSEVEQVVISRHD